MTYTINQNVDVNAQVDIGDLNIHGHTITNTDNGSVVITTGSGSHLDVTYAAHISNLVLSGNDIGTKSSNLNLTFTPHGSGIVKSNAAFEVGNFNFDTSTITTSNDMTINLGATVGDAITIKADGTSSGDLGIGIGTTDPKAKVHISGDYSGYGVLNSGPNKYFSANNSTTSLSYQTGTNQTLDGTSLYADDNIITARYFASHQTTTFSDMRIKKDIVDINDDSALTTIRLIKPKQYKYVDNIANTSEPVWGFIAQEVSSVMNYSTVVMTKAIPNIFALKAYNAGILVLDTTALLTNNEGNLIKKLLIKVCGDREKDVTIKDIVENGVTLEQTLQEEDLVEGNIFVYGQYVDDFHVLKKDAIFTVAVAALQEIDRRQTTDNERILELEGDLVTAEETMAAQDQRIATLEAQVAALLQHTNVTI